jgi:hypothetical protein
MRVAWERSRERLKLGALETGDGDGGQEGDDGDDDHDLHEREAAGLDTRFSRYLRLCQLVMVV